MKKAVFYTFLLILLLGVSLPGCLNNGGNETPLQEEEQQQEGQSAEISQQPAETEEAVKRLVEDFGSKLQTVSLLSPSHIVTKNLQKSYGDLVSPALLEKWLNDPDNAPGRAFSSPWPERIDILDMEKLSENGYEVTGEIIEITSVEMTSGGFAAKRPITLMVEKLENRLLITAATLGAYEESDATVYKNTQYGFSFSLPESWEGYSIVNEKWEGLALEDEQVNPRDNATVETGPMISIRHPEWTSQNQRQDIPIMVFTLIQWESLQQEKFHIGAAPIGPRELGRNTAYVFALPARYNFAFPTGYEEVENILENNPLHPIDVYKK